MGTRSPVPPFGAPPSADPAPSLGEPQLPGEVDGLGESPHSPGTRHLSQGPSGSF